MKSISATKAIRLNCVCICSCGRRKKYNSKTCQKCLGIRYKGIKNPNWKGDKVCYSGLHLWVSSQLEKPDLCQRCKKVPPYDVANIKPNKNKETYNRDLKNWEWLCRRCHMVKDKRLKKLVCAGRKALKKTNSN